MLLVPNSPRLGAAPAPGELGDTPNLDQFTKEANPFNDPAYWKTVKNTPWGDEYENSYSDDPWDNG